jgi:hypothetical protein
MAEFVAERREQGVAAEVKLLLLLAAGFLEDTSC